MVDGREGDDREDEGATEARDAAVLDAERGRGRAGRLFVDAQEKVTWRRLLPIAPSIGVRFSTRCWPSASCRRRRRWRIQSRAISCRPPTPSLERPAWWRRGPAR